MNKVTVKVPASAANLGPGFDTMGMALNVYNVYEFIEQDDYLLVNFDEKYSNDSNLVKVSYKEIFKTLEIPEIKAQITQIECSIPESHGMGSSSACIVAGVLGAVGILKRHGILIDEDFLKVILTRLEGHPDNVMPALLGGLVVSFYDGTKVYTQRLDVSNHLYFTELIPPFTLETKVAREALPKDVEFKTAINNLNHACIMPFLLKNGDFKGIKKATESSIHEIYRYPLIKDGLEIRQELEDDHHVLLISGAGPTLLVISDVDEKIKLDNHPDWIIKRVQIDTKGARFK